MFDIEVNTENVEEFIQTVKNIAPTFGGINLEDIKAPEAFEIEKRLKEELDIPVMHDDQHGTAIISCSSLVERLWNWRERNMEDVQIVSERCWCRGDFLYTTCTSAFGARARKIWSCWIVKGCDSK